jgi:hypothetical protein
VEIVLRSSSLLMTRGKQQHEIQTRLKEMAKDERRLLLAKEIAHNAAVHMANAQHVQIP